MSHDRSRTGPWAWLKGVGTQEDPLAPDWRAQNDYLLTRIWFSRYPRSIRGGDFLVYYAADWRSMPAIVQIASDDVFDEKEAHPKHGDRFRWGMHVRPIVAVDLQHAPTLQQSPIASSRVKRLSHLLLTPGEYATLRDQLLTAAANETAWTPRGPFPL